MNGEVKAYDLGRPMNKWEFYSMPDDLKVEYIQSIQKRFLATDKMIGEVLGMTGSRVQAIRKRLGIPSIRERNTGKMPMEAEFAAWMESNGAKKPVAQPKPVEEPKPDGEFHLTRAEIEVCGTPEFIAKTLGTMFGCKAHKYRVVLEEW